MTDQEINHTIATQINGWIHDEGIFYHDENGNLYYLADYCNSIAHALDLAYAREIGLDPNGGAWTAYQTSNHPIRGTDTLASKAICLCLLESLNPSQSV